MHYSIYHSRTYVLTTSHAVIIAVTITNPITTNHGSNENARTRMRYKNYNNIRKRINNYYYYSTILRERIILTWCGIGWLQCACKTIIYYNRYLHRSRNPVGLFLWFCNRAIIMHFKTYKMKLVSKTILWCGCYYELKVKYVMCSIRSFPRIICFKSKCTNTFSSFFFFYSQTLWWRADKNRTGNQTF